MPQSKVARAAVTMATASAHPPPQTPAESRQSDGRHQRQHDRERSKIGDHRLRNGRSSRGSIVPLRFWICTVNDNSNAAEAAETTTLVSVNAWTIGSTIGSSSAAN